VLVAEGAHVVAGARTSSTELDELAGGGMVRVLETGQFLQGAVHGDRAQRDPGQHRQSRPGGNGALAGGQRGSPDGARATGRTPQQIADQAAHQSVTGRFSLPAEIADAVLLLASDRAANITGADITIDGGLIPTW
jgi:hypothetical protein